MKERIDPLSEEERRERMARVKSKDTKPELLVRQLVHGMGFRYRLHDKKLPGKPDLVFRKKQKVIFVHGCFWHQHGCNQYRMPKSRVEFWEPKLQQNVLRDDRNRSLLKEMGWGILTIWECELKDRAKITNKINAFLSE